MKNRNIFSRAASLVTLAVFLFIILAIPGIPTVVHAATSVSTSITTSDRNPSFFGQTVNLSVTILSSVNGDTRIPTGYAEFRDTLTSPFTVLGRAVIDSTGHATLSTSTLSVTLLDKPHQIKAAYSGDANFAATTGSGGTANIDKLQQVVQADTVKPLITLVGANPQTVEKALSYTELGATVSDNSGSGLLATVNSSSVNVNIVGTYIVTYNAADLAGNQATQVTRTVNVVDTTAPIITIAPYTTSPTNSNITVTASTNEGTLNATSTTFTSNGSFNFVATDLAGNRSTSTVNVTNIDKVAPIITLIGSSTIELTVGDSYTDEGATSSDAVDGDITSHIVVSGDMISATTTAGSYHIFYDVSDTAGNVANQVSRAITVNAPVAPTAPIIILGSYNHNQTNQNITVTASADKGTLNATSTTFTENGSFDFVATDGESGISTTTVTITNIDKVAPIIALNGNDSITLNFGSSYVEQGATVTDNHDATTSAIVTGSVNTASAGTYIIRYNAADMAGNNATSTSRTVIVDPAPVVINNTSGGGGGGGSGRSVTTTTVTTPVKKKRGLTDFNSLMVHWKKSISGVDVDFNNDGMVDILDFNSLMINWGKII